MPNGYTAAIYEGKPVTLRDFLMRVGRGMGFAVLQRDSDPSESVKATMPSTSYAERALAEARERLRVLEGMTPEDADAAAHADFKDATARYDAEVEKRQAMRERYEEMIAQVEAWEPDPLIAGTKEYALRTLRESMKFDCGDPDEEMRFWPEPQAQDGPTWLASQRAAVAKSIASYERQIAEELERTAERNRYIEAFLSSLPAPAQEAGR